MQTGQTTAMPRYAGKAAPAPAVPQPPGFRTPQTSNYTPVKPPTLPAYQGAGSRTPPVKPPPGFRTPQTSNYKPVNPNLPVGGAFPLAPFNYYGQPPQTEGGTVQPNQGHLNYGDTTGAYSPSGAQTEFPAGTYERYKENAWTPSLLTGNQVFGGQNDYGVQFNPLNPASWQLGNPFDPFGVSVGTWANQQPQQGDYWNRYDKMNSNPPVLGPPAPSGKEPGQREGPMPKKTAAAGGPGTAATDTGSQTPVDYGYGGGGGGGGGGGNQPAPWYYGLTTWRF